MAKLNINTERIPGKCYPKVIVDNQLISALTGRDGGLRPSKPGKNGLLQYIWRMARFHSGADVCMPVMANYDLANWLKDNDYKDNVYGILNVESKEFLAELDKVVDEILTRMNLNPNNAATVWGKALGY